VERFLNGLLTLPEALSGARVVMEFLAVTLDDITGATGGMDVIVDEPL